MKRRKFASFGFGAAVVVGCSGLVAGSAAGQIDSSFSYQGRLTDGGSGYTGLANFRVRVFDSAAGGTLVCNEDVNGVTVNNGLFLLEVAACDGEDLAPAERWLELEVNTGGGFAALSPRQKITTTPYAAQTRGLFVNEAGDVAVGNEAAESRLQVQGGNALTVGPDENNMRVSLDSGSLDGFALTRNNEFGIAGFFIDDDGLTNGGAQLNTFVTDGTDSRLVTAMGNTANDDGGFLQLFGPMSGSFPTVSIFGNSGSTAGADQGLIRVGSSGTGASGGRLELEDDAGVARVIAEGGSSTGAAARVVVQTASGELGSALFATASGGSLELYTDGLEHSRIEPDFDGFGSFMELLGSDLSGDVSSSFRWDGARTDGGVVSIFGPSDSIFFEPGEPVADNRVRLPLGSVDSAEIADEAGVAETADSGTSNTVTSSTVTSVGSVSLTCPTDGFVVVIGTAQCSFSHMAGFTSSFDIGVSSTATTLPSNQDMAIARTAALPSGATTMPITVHGVFPVTSGVQDFFLNARKVAASGPDLTVLDEQLTAIFVPTAYGAAGRSGVDVPDGFGPRSIGMAQGEFEAQREQAVMADVMRQQREDAGYASEMRAMRAEMERVRAEQAAMRRELESLRGGAAARERTEAVTPRR